MTKAAIETRILSLYAAGCEAEAYNIREIAAKTGAAYPHAYAAVQEMVASGLLLSNVIGRAVYCRANLSNELARNLLTQALIRKQHHRLSQPNVKNLQSEALRLMAAEPRLLAVVARTKRLSFIVTERAARNIILRRTSLLNCEFLTVEEFTGRLIRESDFLQESLILVGYERLLLAMAPIADQLYTNHASVFRGGRR